MATGNVPKHINPPDLSNCKRTALVSEEMTSVTSDGGWYCVSSINTSTSGSCGAFILDSTQTVYLQASESKDGIYRRATTGWVYFPKGVSFYVRGFFTDANASGLLFAQEIN